MTISKLERAMKKDLKDAGHTIAEYIDPAPGDERDAEETLKEIIGEIDNDDVGRAIAQSDQSEGKPDGSKGALARELRDARKTRPFAIIIEEDEPDASANSGAPPLGKTGS